MNGNPEVWSRAKAGLLEDDAAYFRRRAAEERALAIDAYDPRVQQVHLDMAARYEDIGRSITMFERHLEHQLDVVD